MNELWCVRANFGEFTPLFLKGGYAAIGWLGSKDLSKMKSRDDVENAYRAWYKDEKSPYVIGQQVGQISRFLFEVGKGDYVIVPDRNTEIIHWGVIEDGKYYFDSTSDECRFHHRKKVKWHKEPAQRAQFSVPFQNTIRSSLTVFGISHKKTFFEGIGKPEIVPAQKETAFNYYETILERILELDATEFELLITHILNAMGFEAEHTGKAGDGGVDAIGELSISNMAKIHLYVQAKRYKLGQKIHEKTVKELRQNIPFGGQGSFITTCDFHSRALEAAVENGFPRIGTINGEQLVDILAEHWEDIPEAFKNKLGLKTGLVLS
jgi:predicted Mrr-cat superfamily restriction endonuclease